MTETITLGGRQFALRALKLGQLRLLLDALEAMAGKSGGALIEAAAEIVAAGLAPAHPELTKDGVLDLEATAGELNEAVAAILQVAGLKPEGAPAGEAGPAPSPAPAPASGSPPSTAPSPPVAAFPIG